MVRAVRVRQPGQAQHTDMHQASGSHANAARTHSVSRGSASPPTVDAAYLCALIVCAILTKFMPTPHAVEAGRASEAGRVGCWIGPTPCACVPMMFEKHAIMLSRIPMSVSVQPPVRRGGKPPESGRRRPANA